MRISQIIASIKTAKRFDAHYTDQQNHI